MAKVPDRNREKEQHILGPGDHGTTFGGNPVACAGAKVVLARMTPEFLESVSAKGDYIRSRLAAMDGVTDISGRGLMIGFKISGRDSADVVQEALGKGLMMLTAKDRIRLLPPLVITYDEIDAGLKILENCI